MSAFVESSSAPEVHAEVLTPVRARVWSPVAIAVYALLLGYPAGLALALRDWRVLGMRREARQHLIGTVLFSIVFIGMLVVTSDLAGRIFGLATSVSAFSYLKAKLQSDIAQAVRDNPSLSVEYRKWYAGLGWVVLAYLLFFIAFAIVAIALEVAGLPLPR